MEELINLIFDLKDFTSLPEKLKTSRVLHARGLSGSMISFFIAYIAQRLQKSVVFIAAEQDSGEKTRDDLEQILNEQKISYLPPSEQKPYNKESAYSSLNRLRIETFRNLVNDRHNVIVATIPGFLEKTISPEKFLDNQIFIEKGRKYPFDKFIQQLAEAGYERTTMVDNVGECAIRGGIVDVYSWNYDDPVRIEFFGDEIESIRFFNVVNQRSIMESDELSFLPDIRKIDNDSTFLEYIPDDTIFVFQNFYNFKNSVTDYLDVVNQNYYDLVRNNIFPEKPATRFIDYNLISGTLKKYQIVTTDFISQADTPQITFNSIPPPTFAGSINRFISFLEKSRERGEKVVVQCDTSSQADRLREVLQEEHVDDIAEISEGAVHSGFILPDPDIYVLTDHEIFDRFKRRKTFRRFKSGEYLRSLKSLKADDLIVHIDYGIGRYRGLTVIESKGIKREVIKLAYAEGDSLFVSIDRLNRVQKYTSEDGQTPKITRLGSGEWDRIKKRTKESVQKIAADLIQLYAERKAQAGYSFSQDTHWQKEMEMAFEYEETEDQMRSIVEVKKDLESNQPMDRLLCGDVGYGKTEVAIRAAFKVVLEGKQVAVLVPTTILAYQHYQTFKRRIAGYPVNIEMLSRFRTAKEQKEILHKLQQGTIDIAIGTHRILSDDVQFKNLALLVIDEEQRFGVKHKEKLKQLRKTVDVLTMTATPIPRTLHLSLMGARDLSHIETPPQNRMPVLTEVHEWDDDIIRYAIQREIERQGQVYFVHNRVKTIFALQGLIQKIVPPARIAIAHGQLPEKQLEKIMLDFIHKKYDVLISTMIIENGLDIPNVNTIIIDRADQFGLSQLYQLRGRVGRSDVQAYAYLLLKPRARLTDLAQKRLRAIQDFSDLGSGFKLALRDMEIRGVGNILGKEQSGFVQSVGFDLYCRILEEAVNEIRQDKNLNDEIDTRKDFSDPKIDVDFDLILPKDYIYNETERITIYHRLVNFSRIEDIENLKSELRDRFGPLPREVIYLTDTIELKVLAGKLFASHIILKGNLLKLKFNEDIQNNDIFFKNVIPDLMNQKNLNVQFKNEKDTLSVKIQLQGQNKEDQISFAKKLLKYV